MRVTVDRHRAWGPKVTKARDGSMWRIVGEKGEKEGKGIEGEDSSRDGRTRRRSVEDERDAGTIK